MLMVSAIHPTRGGSRIKTCVVMQKIFAQIVVDEKHLDYNLEH
jgi:hypothetical protein